MLAEGAGQPLGYDQWCALYQKYVVIGWRVRLELVTVDNSNATVVGFCPLTTSSALASFSHYKEVPGNKSVICTPDIDKNEILTSGGVERYLLGNRRAGRMFSDDQLYAATSANPTRPLYGHIYVQPMDMAADVSAVQWILTLEQIVVFFDPITPSRS